jgi:hypothetical protein
MVSARPNAAIVGVAPVERLEPVGETDRYRVEVLSVTPIEGEPDLLSDWQGSQMTAIVPKGCVLEPGSGLMRASLTGPGTIRLMPVDEEPGADHTGG